jgi:hypothetical protein
MRTIPAHVETNKNAVISLVCGISGWVFGLGIFCFSATVGAVFAAVTLGVGLLCLVPFYCIPPISWMIAVILGHISLKETQARGQEGRGMGMAGLIMGYIGLGLIALFLFASIGFLILGGSLTVINELFSY